MLTATEANLLTTRINKMIANIGHTNGTKLPESRTNTGNIALHYWLWNHVGKIVSALEKEAEKNAIKAGVIFDHRKEPLPPGIEKQVYTSDYVSINVKTSNPGSRLDKDRLIALLLAKKVNKDMLMECIEEATVPTAPPHRFSAVLVEK